MAGSVVVVAGAGATTLPLSSLVLSLVHAAGARRAGTCIRPAALNSWSTVSLHHIVAYALINVRYGNKKIKGVACGADGDSN